MVWSVFWGRFLGDHFFAGTLPCSVALVFFGAGALSLQWRSFLDRFFFPVHLVVVCGPCEGVQNIYKTNVILHILKMQASPGAATKTSPKNKNSNNKKLKMYVWCDRLGRSLASTWGGPFFLCTKWVLRWNSKNVQNYLKINGLERF